MATSNPYQEFLRAKVRGAIAEARSASRLTHAGVKGTVLEILVSQLFKPLLPADIGVGTGQVIENYRGILSNQVDIVLYDKSILPPALYDERTGIFPVEAVLYAIEVKTTLTRARLKDAHESAMKLASFGYLPGLKDGIGMAKNHPVEKVRSVVFALSSDLKAGTEADRYAKLYAAAKQAPYLRSVCVVGREYCFDDDESWMTMKPTEEFDEVLMFLAGVTNTYRSVAASRHAPPLGHYIAPEAQFTRGIVTSDVLRVEIRCSGCGFEGKLRPKSAIPNCTIDGSLTWSPCAKCGGQFSSAKGVYVFKDGELVEARASGPASAGDVPRGPGPATEEAV